MMSLVSKCCLVNLKKKIQNKKRIQTVLDNKLLYGSQVWIIHNPWKDLPVP